MQTKNGNNKAKQSGAAVGPGGAAVGPGGAPADAPIPEARNYRAFSRKMVEKQLKTRGIKSEPVLEAMLNVPRHLFVPKDLIRLAYDDGPLPIGLGQTISQPYIVAFMTEQLAPAPGMKILEIGTGSGYQAAVLAYLGCEVYTVELLEELASKATDALAALDFANVTVKNGDGYMGWAEKAPFDAIIVTAAPQYIPEKLTAQLIEGGKMILPVGEPHSVQYLQLLSKNGERSVQKTLLSVRFVPMVEGSQEVSE